MYTTSERTKTPIAQQQQQQQQQQQEEQQLIATLLFVRELKYNNTNTREQWANI